MKDKKCKVCKENFKPLRSLQMVCSPSCGYEYTKQQKIKQAQKDKKKWHDDNMTVQDLMKLAQKVFNTYIRERDKGKPCISCGNPEPKKVNAGHYYSSGGHKSVTFHEDNVHLQCEYCNTYLHGNLLNYQTGLTERIGAEKVFKLNDLAHQTRKYTRGELRELMKEYKLKIKNLRSNK